MTRYDISAYAEATTSWGEDCYKGVLSIQESVKGQWVKAEDMELLQLKLDTMTADRDAEKSMKATARMQRDEQSQRIIGLKERLNHAYKLLGHNP